MFYPIEWSRWKAWIVIALVVPGTWDSARGQGATNDFYIAPEGSAFTVSAPGVLANDAVSGGPGGNHLTATLVSGPANGTLTLNPNGAFTYTPTNNFTGMDGFTYQTSNGPQFLGDATAVIMVVAPGELFYDNFARPTNSGSVFPWVSVSNLMGWVPVTGTWGITNNLLIGHSPSLCYGYAYFNTNWTDYSVQAQIRFAANNAASAGIIGRLNVASTNSSHYDLWVYPEESTEPLGSGNGTAILRLYKHLAWTEYTEIGSPVTLPGVGVDWHTVKLTFKGKNISAYFDGNLVISATDNGSIDGTPAYTNGGFGLNMWSQPSVPYTFSVANLLVETTNTIANYDNYVATTNTTLSVLAPGILANDAGTAPLTALLMSSPMHGSLTLTNNGGFSYTPDNAFSGMDGFTYQCSDGQTTSLVTTVTIAVNNSAFANNDAYGMSSNRTLSLGPPGVLANAQGGTGPLTTLLDSGPTDGSLMLSTNGGFSYTPAKDFIGLDSFTFQCRNSQSTSRVAMATINVVKAEPAPVILSLGLTNNIIAVTWNSAANLIYQLQSRDSLNGTSWVNVPPQMTATGPTTTETKAMGSAAQQFYRISLLTP